MYWDKTIKDELNKFYDNYNHCKIPLEIVWTDDIHLTYLELETDDILKTKRMMDESLKENAGGTIVLPRLIGDTSFILAVKHIKDSPMSINTVIHELVHIHDEIDFAREFCDSILSETKNHELALGYSIWTEFHASYIGNIFFYNFLLEHEDEPEYIISDIKDDLEFYVADLENKLFCNRNTHHPALYHLAIYIGWILVLEKLSEGDIKFTNCISGRIACNIPSIISLYNLLSSMMDFESAKEKFGQLIHLKSLTEAKW